MPRPCSVQREEIITVIEKYMEHFTTNIFPTYSSPVWKQMAKDLGNRWTHHNVYTNIRENRRKCLSEARANLGVDTPIEVKSKLLSTKVEYCGYEQLDEDIEEVYNATYNNAKLLNIADDLSDFEPEQEAAGLSHFDVLITREEWREMRGASTLYGARGYTTLCPGIWTNILALAVARQTRLPCAFAFDSSKIYDSPNALHYLRIKGHCRSKACSNALFAYLDHDPGDNDFYINVRTRDTFGQDHEDVHRPMKGAVARRRRVKGKEEVVSDGDAVTRQQAAKYVNIFLCRRCNYPNIIARHKK